MEYTQPSKAHLPKRARSIPLREKGKDAGKWFKCWNCGFPCNTDRDDSSGSTAGDNHVDFHSPSLGFVENGQEDRMLAISDPPFFHTIMENDATGSAKTIVHEHLTNVTKGCPFCGTTNFKN